MLSLQTKAGVENMRQEKHSVIGVRKLIRNEFQNVIISKKTSTRNKRAEKAGMMTRFEDKKNKNVDRNFMRRKEEIKEKRFLKNETTKCLEKYLTY